VESLQLKDALEEMGCDEWQGFLNSKPLPANEFEKRFLLDAKQI
jgi:EAL domain-containing protein (putative c-di-GMP-specific phosphodiesterase class I)